MLLLPWSEFYLLRRLNYNLTTLALLNRDTMQVLALVKTISCDFVLSFQMLNKPPVWLFISRQMSFDNFYCVMSWLLQPHKNFLNYAKQWRIFQSGLKPQTIFFLATEATLSFCQKSASIRQNQWLTFHPNMLVPLVCTVLWNFFLKTVASSLFSPVPPNWCDLVNPTLPKVRP